MRTAYISLTGVGPRLLAKACTVVCVARVRSRAAAKNQSGTPHQEFGECVLDCKLLFAKATWMLQKICDNSDSLLTSTTGSSDVLNLLQGVIGLDVLTSRRLPDEGQPTAETGAITVPTSRQPHLKLHRSRN